MSHILCIDVDVSIFQLRTLMPDSLSSACVLFLIQRSVCDFYGWQVKLDHQASSLTWYLRIYQSSLQIATTNGWGLYGWFGLEGNFPTSVTHTAHGESGDVFPPWAGLQCNSLRVHLLSGRMQLPLSFYSRKVTLEFSIH